MKLGVLTVPLYGKTLEETLLYLSRQGVECVELGAGGYPGSGHLNVQKLLTDDGEVKYVKNLLKQYNMSISAISCHGNPVHPDEEIAAKFHIEFIDAILIAEKLGVDTVISFSGCPGGGSADRTPNWVTCPWPEDFSKTLEYQWDEVLIPYWKKVAEFADAHNVSKIALEMHPGFCVYNTETLLKLREAVGNIIGANFDPSHLIWQGMDPCMAIRELKGAIHHFHAKDTKIDRANTARIGVLDNKHYGDILNRAWVFRTIGYGDGKWNDIISALRSVGYDGAVSIEHEDALMSVNEGLEKAIANLKAAIVSEPVGGIWWA